MKGRGVPAAWIDLENTPHVLFLEPIVKALEADGISVFVSAKPQSQTLELARQRNLPAVGVGDGNLKGTVAKVTGGARRTLKLLEWLSSLPLKPRILVHSSRSASLAALLSGIRGVGLLDYEHAIQWPLALASDRIWFPDVLDKGVLPLLSRRVAKFYDGLKENFYLDGVAAPDRIAVRQAHGLTDPAGRLVVARPPAQGAHYANADSWRWWTAAIQGLLGLPQVSVLVVPRDPTQRETVKRAFLPSPRVRILTDVVDVPELIASADLVVGGGGTMNREAAVLGTHAWSAFCGPSPAIDMCLATEGRLNWVTGAEGLAAALRNPFPRHPPRGPATGLTRVVEDILSRIA